MGSQARQAERAGGSRTPETSGSGPPTSRAMVDLGECLGGGPGQFRAVWAQL